MEEEKNRDSDNGLSRVRYGWRREGGGLSGVVWIRLVTARREPGHGEQGREGRKVKWEESVEQSEQKMQKKQVARGNGCSGIRGCAAVDTAGEMLWIEGLTPWIRKMTARSSGCASVDTVEYSLGYAQDRLWSGTAFDRLRPAEDRLEIGRYAQAASGR